jgi:DNA replication protein DnaC
MSIPKITDFEELEKYCLAKAAEGGELETEEQIEARHILEDAERARHSAEVLWQWKVRKSGIPAQLENPSRKWEQIQGTEAMIKAVIEYENDIEGNVSKGVNLIIIGGKVGTGKSRSICRVGFKMLRAGIDVMFFDDKVLAELLGMESFSDIQERDELIGKLTEIPVIILDDYGDGKYSASAESRLHQILSVRYNKCMPILMTGNWLDLADMEKKVPPRIYSRLHERAIVAVNKSERDMRLG